MSAQAQTLSAAERIDALLTNHPKGYDLSLDRIRGLLDKLGNPQDSLPPVVHVAGTNGKGSTIAFCRTILEAAGLAVHVDTSPHLVNWHERFRLGERQGGGQLVTDAVLSEAIGRVAAANAGQPITVFEVLTAVMFVLFAEHPADACLIEVGLGGRFDSTNVMKEVAVSVIAPVAMDHESHLGDTLAKIAFEKAGIIRAGTPVVAGPQQDEALAVIERQAARNRAPLSVAGEDFQTTIEDGRLLFQDGANLLDLSLPRLPGAHQVENAGTAIATCRILAERLGFVLTEDMIDAGLAAASWPGRLQRLTAGRLIERLPPDCEVWVDGGHNPHAAAALARHFAELNDRCSRPLLLVCGMLNTKDPSGYFEQLSGLVHHAYMVPLPSSDAAIPPAELAEISAAHGIPASPYAGLEAALRAAAHHGDDGRILVAGSLYLAGDFLAANGTPPQ